jgi:protein SCO1/2
MARLPGVFACLYCLLAGGVAAAAQSAAELSSRAGFEQHLEALLPADAIFRDESGRAVQLRDYYGAVPMVLVFSYYGCTTLCPTAISNLADKLQRSGLQADAQYQVLAVSIDPRDSPSLAAAKKTAYLAASPSQAGAWHLLTGDESGIAALAHAVGFHYAWDSATGQYAHPAGIVLLTPRGVIARYFFGFDFAPAELRAAIAGAQAGHISSPVERLLLLCFHFDPATGKDSVAVMTAMRWMALTMLLAAIAWLTMQRMRR